MNVRVYRVEVRRGFDIAVLFGRVGGRDVYALDEPSSARDLAVRLARAAAPWIDVILPDNKVALLRSFG